LPKEAENLSMKKHLVTAFLYTAITAVALGIIYPLVITGIAQLAFHNKANGQLITRNGHLIGSRIIGQPFTGPGYFHSRPSAAGSGYDASSSSGSNLGPTNKSLIVRIDASVAAEANAGTPIPIDLVTASASGLDPDISPAAALYQVPRVARERKLPEDALRQLVMTHTRPRQFGLLGELTVNVLELNLALQNSAL
jgi:K+-transporting ATPase ATPase C chain